MSKDSFFSEMNQLPPGYTEQFNEDEYINTLGKKGPIQKGLFGDRKKFQETVFGKQKLSSSTETKLVEEIETLLTAKGYKQNQQGRHLLLECVKHLKKLGVIHD